MNMSVYKNNSIYSYVTSQVCKMYRRITAYIIIPIDYPFVKTIVSYVQSLTFRGPCIMIYSYNNSQRDSLFLTFI